jgi:hypothetical protein
MAKNHTNAKAWARDTEKVGKASKIYGVAPNASNIVGAAIATANSADEVLQQTHTFPMAAFLQFEVLPLADFDQTMDSIATEIPQRFHG